MAFEHHPGLAALHSVITGGQQPAPQKELEEIVKDIADDAKVERQEAERQEIEPVIARAWKGFGS